MNAQTEPHTEGHTRADTRHRISEQKLSENRACGYSDRDTNYHFHCHLGQNFRSICESFHIITRKIGIGGMPRYLAERF